MSTVSWKRGALSSPGNAEGGELAALEAAARAPVDPAARQHVQQRHLLGEAQRVVERRQRHRRADAQPFGARRGHGAHHVHRRADREAGKMMLGEPDGVVAGLVHDGEALERRFVDRIERHGPVAPAEELQNADFHVLSRRARLRRMRSIDRVNSNVRAYATPTAFVATKRSISSAVHSPPRAAPPAYVRQAAAACGECPPGLRRNAPADGPGGFFPRSDGPVPETSPPLSDAAARRSRSTSRRRCAARRSAAATSPIPPWCGWARYRACGRRFCRCCGRVTPGRARRIPRCIPDGQRLRRTRTSWRRNRAASSASRPWSAPAAAPSCACSLTGRSAGRRRGRRTSRCC